jgi:hypothetical protein
MCGKNNITEVETTTLQYNKCDARIQGVSHEIIKQLVI